MICCKIVYDINSNGINNLIKQLQSRGDIVLNNNNFYFKSLDPKVNKKTVSNILKKNNINDFYIDELKKDNTNYPEWIKQWIDLFYYEVEKQEFENSNQEELSRIKQKFDNISAMIEKSVENISQK